GSLVASQCWNQKEGFQRTLNFYCGGEASSPATPPTGTYQVVVTASDAFTFDGVTSRTIEADLSNVYVPAVMLTMNSGKIIRIDWQWWKKVGPAWIMATDGELAGALSNAGFEIGQSNWAGDRVRGNLGLTTSGSVAPPTQSFTPGAVRISFSDRSGYSYGFEWR
ncbi:MAG: hypothetical protein LAN62_07785, partial [Acidobacteriia bacterium]|nr:hypothetical protein [Terriglobia bacterium]